LSACAGGLRKISGENNEKAKIICPRINAKRHENIFKILLFRVLSRLFAGKFLLLYFMRKFLTAKWLDLVMANYAVEPKILQEFVPLGTELDLFDGTCFVSLVAFKFYDTRVLNFRIPFHINFLEVNLRFYVRRESGGETRRGVVFVKEIVPRFAISLVARSFYGEPYETWKMRLDESENEFAYSWTKGGKTNLVSANKGANLGVPPAGSQGEFIIEHYWGYTRRGAHRTDEYKVEHPKWNLFEAKNASVDVDFNFTYGERFGFLKQEKPQSVLLAEGSEIAVYKGARVID
jgi:uncharacterized protein